MITKVSILQNTLICKVVSLTLSHGLTIVAFGNGAPDIFSAIAAFTNSNPSTAGVAIGGLLGEWFSEIMLICCN